MNLFRRYLLENNKENQEKLCYMFFQFLFNMQKTINLRLLMTFESQQF